MLNRPCNENRMFREDGPSESRQCYETSPERSSAGVAQGPPIIEVGEKSPTLSWNQLHQLHPQHPSEGSMSVIAWYRQLANFFD